MARCACTIRIVAALLVIAAAGALDCRSHGAAAVARPAVDAPAPETAPPPWPEWVLRHWVWEDESTQESALALVRGYLERGIRVGAVVIDSPWETGYNTFEFDPERFPRPAEMIDEFHRLGVRVVLWVTPVINLDAPNYAEADRRGFLLDSGGPVSWWKGEGRFLDYRNPEALAWWHARMDSVLDLGIDGWKCDGAVAYIPRGRILTGRAGPVDLADYRATYYRDFFHYTRERLGRDRVILARAVDTMPFPAGTTDYAPRDVNYAAWAGDQQPDFDGLRAALANIFRSAEKGYVNVGSDVGGYFDDGPRDPELFVRWAQLGAWTPLFENGGMGEHRPWAYREPVLDVYRRFAALHDALVPYLYSEGARRFREERSLVTPVDPERGAYMLGDAFFVSAITEPGGRFAASLPPGTWYDFWTSEAIAGGREVEATVGLDRYPVYVRAGAIVPTEAQGDDIFFPDESAYVVTIYAGRSGEFVLREEDGPGARIVYDEGETTTVRLTAPVRPYALRLIGTAEPASVTAGDRVLDRVADLTALREREAGWFHGRETGLWIKPPATVAGRWQIVRLTKS